MPRRIPLTPPYPLTEQEVIDSYTENMTREDRRYNEKMYCFKPYCMSVKMFRVVAYYAGFYHCYELEEVSEDRLVGIGIAGNTKMRTKPMSLQEVEAVNNVFRNWGTLADAHALLGITEGDEINCNNILMGRLTTAGMGIRSVLRRVQVAPDEMPHPRLFFERLTRRDGQPTLVSELWGE